MKKRLKTKKRVPPLGIKVCSIIIFIISFLGFITSLATPSPTLDIAIKVILLGLFSALVLSFLGIFLWKGKNWARIIIIIIFIFFILFYVYNIVIEGYKDFTSIILDSVYIFYIVLLSLFVLYLLINKKVKEYFKR